MDQVRRRSAWLAALTAMVPVAVSGCSLSSDPPTGGEKSSVPEASAVFLVGDSLAEQAAQYLAPLLGSARLEARYFGGSAPCDWLEDDLQITEGSVVVISFTGNSMTPCMSDGAGGYLQGEAIVDRYQTDIAALIDLAHSAGARALLVGQPVHSASLGDEDVVAGVNRVYVELSDAMDTPFVDAGAAVENPDGTFAESLPCLVDEAECGPSGVNVVRNDDGLHFCPGSPPPGPCAAYSSGAYRFAATIAQAVTGP